MNLQACRRMVLVLWVGGMAFAGAVVAPIAFSLFDVAVAGTLTGAVFRAAAWLTLIGVAAFVLLLPAGARRGARLWLALTSAALVSVAVFGMGGFMDVVRESSGAGSVPGWVHGVAMLGYFGATLAALALIWIDARAVR